MMKTYIYLVATLCSIIAFRANALNIDDIVKDMLDEVPPVKTTRHPKSPKKPILPSLKSTTMKPVGTKPTIPMPTRSKLLEFNSMRAKTAGFNSISTPKPKSSKPTVSHPTVFQPKDYNMRNMNAANSNTVHRNPVTSKPLVSKIDSKTTNHSNRVDSKPMGCKELFNARIHKKITRIKINGVKPFYVKCDHSRHGGGWTVIFHRYNGSRSFTCQWEDCAKGFGNINQEFFIGLRRLHAMVVSSLHELIFIMEDFDNVTKVARYNAFAIDDEKHGFAINVLGDYSGNAGDSFTYHSGYKFSTLDRDSSNGCPKKRSAPGWFNHCSLSNIFGIYLHGSYRNSREIRYRGMCWYTFRGPSYSLKSMTLLIRPLD